MGKTLNALALGLGVGYLNASFLGVPGWANIILMSALIGFDKYLEVSK